MIRVHDLKYAVGTFRLDVSLDIARGEYFMIMGATGSGKTALAECVAGLRQPLSGTIRIAGRDATALDPRDRGIGYVPQDYALFAHRTVRRNVSFGPEVRGWTGMDIHKAVEDTARLLGIQHLLERRIQGLSGGERQRVALARALATRPEVLILDEPVSALDESTRESVCHELRQLQRSLGVTTLHISHNMEEAFSLADRAAVMRGGRVEQVGRLEDLMRRPRNRSVAQFMRCENVIEGECEGPGTPGDVTRVKVNGIEVLAPGRHEGRVGLVIRPENLRVLRPGDMRTDESGVVIPCRIGRFVDRGIYVRIELDSDPRLVAHVTASEFAGLLGRGEAMDVGVMIPARGIHVFA